MMNRALRNRSVAELSTWVFRRICGLSTASLRILPDFIIIGAQRCGTTSLFNYLCQHPDVHPSFPKEIHYFSNYFSKGPNWYRSHFPLMSHKRKVESSGSRKFLTGEATPYYLAHPHAARRAAQVVPNALLIVLLRNPVERAYSHYYHEVRMGVEALSFEEAIKSEAHRLDKEFEKMRADENFRSFNYQHFSYLSRGLYFDQIMVWKRYFPAEAILFVSSDELDSDPYRTWRVVTDFLGLSSWDQIDFSKYHTSAYPAMNPELRKQLVSYFRPHNQKLSELTRVIPFQDD